MTTMEFRLAGRQASVTGITRVINRHLDGKALRRVEIRYSTQAVPPIDMAEAKRSIGALLREHGLASVELSMRALDSPIDDVLAEHVVRLIHADAPQRPQRSARWAAWWSRWFGAGPARAGSGEIPSAARSEPRVDQRQAIELLSKALVLAVRAQGQRLGAAEVATVSVTVRLEALHRALQGLVARDAAGAARWFRRLLQQQRVTAADDLAVAYAFLPAPQGEGTELAGGSDIEVQLSATPSTMLPYTAPTVASPPAATLMPEAAPPRRNSLTVRVLGTLDKPFETPFELRFETLPARFDRAALEAAGFAQRHGGLLRVVSQRCPLLIDRALSGSLVLQASPRAEGSALPMYFRADNQSGLVGEVALQVKRQRLIVNGPNALVDGTDRERLQPLLIELVLDDAPGAPPVLREVVQAAFSD